MPTRRTVLVAPLIQAAASSVKAAEKGGKMTLCLHQNTSAGAGYRKSLEGWARAGIKQVEITSPLLDEFLKTDTLAAARKVVTDLGLTAVSCSPGQSDYWNPTPDHASKLDTFKRRCEQYATFGIRKIYNPSNTTVKITRDDYKGGVDIIRDTGEVARQFNMVAMIEFTRASGFYSSLATTVKQIHAAAHPNTKVLFDFYHFWSGPSKFEDTDLLDVGDVGHVHFQDVPGDIPREMLNNATRLIPGDGITPKTKILKKLAEKGYSGPVSVELFLPEFQQGDPYEVASMIRTKAEAVLHQAKVG